MILLGIALLPIGLIAITQTLRMMSEVEARTSAALLGETLDAAKDERELILTALGASRGLASIGPALIEDIDNCSAPFIELRERLDAVSFAGVTLRDGSVICGSSGVGSNLSESPSFREFFENPVESVNLVLAAPISGQNVILVRQPVVVNGEVVGYIAISTALAAFAADDGTFGNFKPEDIITFAADGAILTAHRGLEGVEDRLPMNRALKALSGQTTIFQDTDRNGVDHVYTVAPLLRDTVFVMASWSPEVLGIDQWSLAGTIAFPLLMWMASLAVAYFAVHALVIRHIRSLRHRIRQFSASRRLIDDGKVENMPAELREVTEAFQTMTTRIVRDEADLENSLHEKDVLLKEVHHRVKNNLQLIASMTNMQIRKTEDSRTRSILRRLQDRVLGMAAVHRSLYEAQSLSQVRADHVLREIANQLMRNMALPGAGIGFEVRTERVSLYPDQALPLSLLLTEALTNALKYLGRPADGTPRVTVDLTIDDDEMVQLVVENSLGQAVAGIEDMEGSGLGTQLIAAFTMQLGAVSRTETTDTAHRMVVRFHRSVFDVDGAGDAAPSDGAVAETVR